MLCFSRIMIGQEYIVHMPKWLTMECLIKVHLKSYFLFFLLFFSIVTFTVNEEGIVWLQRSVIPEMESMRSLVPYRYPNHSVQGREAHPGTKSCLDLGETYAKKNIGQKAYTNTSSNKH